MVGQEAEILDQQWSMAILSKAMSQLPTSASHASQHSFLSLPSSQTHKPESTLPVQLITQLC